MSLLGSAGFDLYSSNPNNLTSQLSTFTSPLLSPTHSSDDTSVNALDLNGLNLFQGPARPSINAESGAVFTRSRSSTDATRSSSSSGSRANYAALTQMTSRSDFAPSMGAGTSESATDEEAENTPAPPSRPPLPRSHSHSPSSCEVRALPSDLTVVGLADDSADIWGLKIVKLVAFPELIPGVARGSRSSVPHSYRGSSSGRVTIDRDGNVNVSSRPIVVGEPEFETEAGIRSGSDTTTRVGLDSPKKDPGSESLSDDDGKHLDGDNDGDDDDDDDEAYDTDESSENGVPPAEETNLSPILVPEEPTRPPNTEPKRRPPLPHRSTLRPSDESALLADEQAASHARSPSPPRAPPLLVPFFSFTRTPEGSSLAAPVSVLAKLFPAHERYMVICSDELDVRDSRVGSPDRDSDDCDDVDIAEDESDFDEEGAQGPLRCLQIDLRKFGLGTPLHYLSFPTFEDQRLINNLI